jgi:hypothetical protein
MKKLVNISGRHPEEDDFLSGEKGREAEKRLD